jgi:hypothetical protein
MRAMRRVVVALASFVILPATVFAQASLSGFVKAPRVVCCPV